jgi:hypothetical protein
MKTVTFSSADICIKDARDINSAFSMVGDKIAEALQRAGLDVSIRWANILDSEHNPDGSIGYFILGVCSEPISSPTTGDENQETKQDN